MAQRAFIYLLLALALTSQVQGKSDDNNRRPGDKFERQTIFVKLKQGHESDFEFNRINAIGAEAIKRYRLVRGLYLFRLPPNLTVDDALEWFKKQPEIEYVEPNFVVSVAPDEEDANGSGPSIATNDPFFPSQWSLENTGQSGGTVDADINATASWQIQPGNRDAVIGIIDSGVDYNHSDLNANLWQNPVEIAGNAIDDDANGYVDDVYGVNTITDTGDPFDDFHHGTRVAGIIGGVAENSLGITGIMQVANIISCKFLNNTGTGSASNAIECMEYFADLKTRSTSPENVVAVNNSWILNSYSQAIEDAIAQFRNLGIVFVAAAGNTNSNNDVIPTYPANYRVTNIISVAATDRNDNKASFSSYGKATVDVAAPGVSILSTIPNQGYSSSSGTSLAAPHVTGLIGLLASQFPSLGWSALKNLVIAGGKVLPNLQTNTLSSRRVRGADVGGIGSLTCSNQVVLGRVEPLETSRYVAINSSLLLRAMHINCEVPNGNVTLYNDGTTIVTLVDDGTSGDDYAGDGVYSLNWVPTVAGTFSLNYGNGDIVSVRVYDPSTWHNYDTTIDATFTAETFTGTLLGAGNDNLFSLTSPFPILLGGDSIGFNNLYISTNGALSFTDPILAGGINTAFPASGFATLLALFWDDLIFTASGSGIYYQVLGSAPNRKLVIEWRNFKHFNVAGLGIVQVIFYEGSSNIRMAYKDTDLGSATYNYGNSATVGVQLSPTLFKQYSFLKPNVPSNRSLLYTLQP